MQPELPPDVSCSHPSIICSICGDLADGQHFGTNACRACAAFFRRTIARNLEYICRSDNNCPIDKVYRCMCRWCRLQKCYRVGMKADAVQRSRAPTNTVYHQTTLANNRPAECPSISPPRNQPPHIFHTDNDLHISPVSDENTATPSTSSSITVSRHNTFGDNEAPKTMAAKMMLSQLHQNQRQTCTPGPLLSGYNCSDAEKSRILQNFLQICSSTKVPDVQYPLPIINKIQMGYSILQRRRDELYGTPVNSESGTTTKSKRIFTPGYVEDNNREINFVGEMLTSFHGFSEIPDMDKIKMFKHFWIHFLILERCYDTFRVCSNITDLRLVFPEGVIVDTLNYGIDVTECGVSNLSSDEVIKTCKPWFITVAKTLLPSLKGLEPTEVEICFCFSLLLFNVTDIVDELSPGSVSFCKAMVEAIYNELNSYYLSEFQGRNVLRRIVELMSLINSTEKIAIQRREEMFLTKMFNVFKKNIFLDGIFHDA